MRPGLVRSQLLLLPSAGFTVLLFLVPLAMVAVYSFGQENFVTFNVYFGWTTSNYTDIANAVYLPTLLRSLALSVSTTAACAALGFPLAYFISRQPGRWQGVLLGLVMIPFWTSFLVRTYAWINLLQNGGPVDEFLRHLGLLHGHLNFLYTPGSVGLGIVYDYLPLMVLPIYVALERIDPALLDAGADLGANGWRVFRRVVLPLGLPGVIAGSIIVGIPATGEYVIPEILGGGKTLMLGNVLANQFLDVGNFAFGSAVAMSITALMLLVLVTARLARREEPAT
jgi:spermidine/putrescine transport system permease protein